MSTDNPSLAEQDRCTITAGECAAMTLLEKDGWNRKTLEIVFECSTATVSRHVNGDCKIHNVGGTDE